MSSLKYEPEDKSMLSKGSLSSVKDDRPKPEETQPMMNKYRFYGGPGAMGELRNVGRGVVVEQKGKEIVEKIVEAVSQPTIKFIMVVYSAVEVSEVYKSVKSVVKVVAMLSAPLSYARDSKTSDGKAEDINDMKRGRFWQTLGLESFLLLASKVTYEVAEWRNVNGKYNGKAVKGIKDKSVRNKEEILEDEAANLPTLVSPMYWMATIATSIVFIILKI